MKFYKVAVSRVGSDGKVVEPPVRYIWAGSMQRVKEVVRFEEQYGRVCRYDTIEFHTSKDELLWLLNMHAAAPEKAAPDVAGMVNRFLSWPLPKDFYPDAGVHFDGAGKTPEEYVDGAGYKRSWPVGTNLFTAIQAEEMIHHMLREE